MANNTLTGRLSIIVLYLHLHVHLQRQQNLLEDLGCWIAQVRSRQSGALKPDGNRASVAAAAGVVAEAKRREDSKGKESKAEGKRSSRRSQ